MWIAVVVIIVIFICVWTTVFILNLKTIINPHKFFEPQLYKDFYHNTVPDRELPQVFNGIEKARNSRIIFTGLARDLEKIIERNIKNISLLGKEFKDYRIVIFENDSKDKTREIIEEIALKNPKVELVECEVPRCKLNKQYPYKEGLVSFGRIKKMAKLRNRYLTHIYEKYADWDYVFVSDLDIEGLFFRNGFFHGLSKTDEYSGIFSNGLFTVPGFGILSPYDGMAYSRSRDYEKYNIVYKFYRQFRDVKGKKEIVEVESAFNGGALYVLKDILGKKHNVTADTSCEHNPLNYELRDEGKKLGIDPLMEVYVGPQGRL